jgi:hypothetical protein
MSRLAHSNDDTMEEIEQRALFDHDSDINEDEAFEILHAAGVDEIKWSDSLNNSYIQWVYFNIK